MKLAIAFLCYNNSSAPYLPEFLASLDLALVKVGADILVLAGDNSDQTFVANKDLISKHNLNSAWPAHLISFDRNLGFAAAYNRLIGFAVAEQADYFLMLNPDMILDAQMISRLLSGILNDEKLVAVCPKIYRWDFATRAKTNIIDSCGLMMKSGLRFYDLGQGEKDAGSYNQALIFGPSGAVALFRLNNLDKIKENGQYFDERFFMYKEDCDLAYRLHLSALTTKLIPEAIAYHDRSSAGQSSFFQTWQDWRRRSPLTRSWSFVNQHLLFLKYFSREAFFSRLLVIIRVLAMVFFSLIFAPFLLKQYKNIWNRHQGLD